MDAYEKFQHRAHILSNLQIAASEKRSVELSPQEVEVLRDDMLSLNDIVGDWRAAASLS